MTLPGNDAKKIHKCKMAGDGGHSSMLDASLERMRAENQVVHQQQIANFALPVIYLFLYCFINSETSRTLYDMCLKAGLWYWR